ncbi:XI-H [Linum perenne]
MEKLEALITCVEKKTVGFHQGKPVAAITIYRCLVEWGSFEAERTPIFDHLIYTIGTAFEHEDDNDYLAYWLSNCAMLLFLLQRTLIRGNCDLRVGKDFILPVVDPKYPALLFKLQVTAYLETMYGMMRDNVKKELSPLLASCIKAAKAKRNDVGLMNWNRMVESFESMLSSMKENFVPTFFIRKVFCQIFFHIDVNLFNSLLLRPECCTSSNGEFVKSGLDRLKAWFAQANQKLIRSAWDELKHTKQAVGFLVIHKKSKISYEHLATNLCPVISISEFTLCSLRKLSDCKNAALFLQALSVQQLHRLCTMYEDENINTGNGISPDVISTMEKLVEGVSDCSFFLEESSRLMRVLVLGLFRRSTPFKVDELCDSYQEKDYSKVKSPEELAKKPGFEFIKGLGYGSSATSRGLKWKFVRRLLTPVVGGEMPQSQPATKVRAISRSRSLEANMEAPGQENLEALITCVDNKVGFHQGKPVAAITIYRCLVEWGSFEAEKTPVFDHLIYTIGTAFEHEDEYDYLAYWLSNCAMLLFLLQRTLVRGNSDVIVGKDFILPVVDPKKPALLFKQQVTAYLETIYGMIRDNVKHFLSPLLDSCIKAAKAKKNDVGLMNWNRLVEYLEEQLSSMKENFVPAFLIQKAFCQIFYHINVNLFNSLFLSPKCCTLSNGEFVKSGLDRLEAWCSQANQELIRSAWGEELKHTRQAVGFLVIHKKSKISYDKLSKNICPVICISQLHHFCLRKLEITATLLTMDCKNAALFQALSVTQLLTLCTTYEDENGISADVISTMEKLVERVSDCSFLLEESSRRRTPFTVDELCDSYQEKDYSQVKPPEELAKKPGFEFLLG